MIFLNIGEPDFTAPPPVRDAAERCLHDGRTQYTQATGDPELRERIAQWYAQPLRPGHRAAAHRRHRRRVGGAAAGLPGAVRARRRGADARPQLPLQPPLRRRRRRRARCCCRPTPAQRFQLDADGVRRRWSPATRGVLLASPSNPTGTSIPRAEMAAHRRRGARARRRHDRRRDLPRPELRRSLRPQRARAAATTSSRSTASPSTSA